MNTTFSNFDDYEIKILATAMQSLFADDYIQDTNALTEEEWKTAKQMYQDLNDLLGGQNPGRATDDNAD